VSAAGKGSERPGSPVAVVAGIVVEGSRVLIAQRPAGQSFPLKWEFPGGKVEPGESPPDALVREFREELGIGIRALERFGEVRYRRADGRDLEVVFYLAARTEGEPRPLQVAAVTWVEAPDLVTVDFIPANRPIVKRLHGKLTGGEGTEDGA
jgi:8-oxo-dGTP diphosphatase